MTYNIWGRDKEGKARLFALHVPPSEEKEFLERAKEEGWTNLLVDRKPAVAEESEDEK